MMENTNTREMQVSSGQPRDPQPQPHGNALPDADKQEKRNPVRAVDLDSLDADDHAALETAEGNVPLCRLSNLLVALPNMLAPFTYGYEIGIVGPYNTLRDYATDCARYEARTPCETLSGVRCVWAAAGAGPQAGMSCQWRDVTTCALAYGADMAACGGDGACRWDYGSRQCANLVGYSSIYKGVFAGSMIIGSLVGALVGGTLTKRLNYRLTFVAVGVLNLMGSVLVHVATGKFIYWLLFVARIIQGFPMGWQAVAAPAYVSEFAPAQWQQMFGTLFQVSTFFGQFICSVFAIALGNTIQYKSDTNANLQGRMQGLISLPTLLSLLILCMVPILKNSKKAQEQTEDDHVLDDETSGSNGNRTDDNNNNANKQTGSADGQAEAEDGERPYSAAMMGFLVLIGICMAASLQLTGINAVMNFAPTIMGSLGLDPLVGNIIVMAWSSLTCFSSIPLSRFFTLRTLHIVTLLLASLICVFLCGVPVYPGVTKVPMAKNVVAIIGIALFILMYSSGFGPAFFVLAGDLFPKKFRPIGQSITVGVMFICNVIINICYPIATEAISGGPSGNQDKGQSIAFIFFGGIGFITLVIEFFFMKPWYGKEDKKGESNNDAVELDEIPEERE